jgi:signal transduction histidine kinase/CheY-like chemotaxis protein
MKKPILKLELRFEHDLILSRQRTRQIAALLGFSPAEQTRLSTAVSEIARNAFRYAGGGGVTFSVDGTMPQVFFIAVADHGPGISNLDEILEGRYTSPTGMGMGIIGARRLMDHFSVESAAGSGTRVVMGKNLPPRAALMSAPRLAGLADELLRRPPETPLEEIQQQNRELLHTLEELRARQAELAQLNHELEDTNRGVVALYAELEDRADYLQRASDVKTRFLSNMSHEFRTPLNAILSLSHLLLDRADGDLTPEQEKQIGFVRKSAQDLSELVNDLLDLAKVEAGKVQVHSREFEVPVLFSALRGMLRPLLAGNSVNLVFDDPVGLPPLCTDESKISQVLRNFISNALKYTERGQVLVSARMQDAATVVFAVADTGVGIAPEDQERIFEEWVQLENPLQRRVRGTGLGLPLSRKLAELLGGRIWVESQPSIGSTFYAAFPIAYAGPQEVTLISEAEFTLDHNRQPVLVVEDNRETLQIYQSFLRNTGFQTVPATTISAARRALQSFRPAAVLMDILLHDESTWGLLSELKGNPATSSIPVIVATVVENRAKAKALGADEFHLKPLERLWLLKTLKELTRPGHKPRILIIDDDEVSRYVLKSLLSRQTYDVLEAASGGGGLTRARQEQPQAIFLDLVMPGMSGYEVLNRLKADPATRGIPVIISTSKSLSEGEREQLMRECAAILSKENSSSEAALITVQQALDRAGLARLGLPL